ncbi:MAG TPA: cytochrome c oxidase assembly protein [Acetobacteraceae bacterium]|nr:cytochrome c oxidase assembly protein [Acetobacteraceae bacterium]
MRTGESSAPARPSGIVDRPELAAVALIASVGLLLAWLSRDHPAQLPALAPWEFSWPEYLAASCGLWWYARGLWRSAPASRPPWRKRILYLAGVGLLYAVLQTRFLYLAEHMFFLHRVQHIVMHHLGPFLIALAWPGETIALGMPGWARRVALSRSARRVCGAVQHPVVAAVLFAGLVFLWLYPPLHFRAMVDARLYALMNWSMVVDGIFFFVLVLDPRPVTGSGLSFAGRIVLALSVQIPQIALGGVLAAATADLYPWYDLCGRIFPGIDATTDQELGAFVILFPGGMMSALAALIVLGRLWRAEEAAARGDAAPSPAGQIAAAAGSVP